MRGARKRADIDKLIENGKSTRFNGDSAAKAGRKSAQARQNNLNLQRIAQKILTAKPAAADNLKDQLKDTLGIDTEDAEMLTTASLMFVKLVQRAMNDGDLATIKAAFEMAGQLSDAKGIADKARLDLERERLELDKAQASQSTGEEMPTIIIRRE